MHLAVIGGCAALCGNKAFNKIIQILVAYRPGDGIDLVTGGDQQHGGLQSLQKDGGDILQQIEQEARQNYAQNLTLKSLSQKYYVNSAYLGQMLKKKNGVFSCPISSSYCF